MYLLTLILKKISLSIDSKPYFHPIDWNELESTNLKHENQLSNQPLESISSIKNIYIYIYISLRLDICSPDRNARARAFKKRHDIKFITGDERERKRKAGRSLNDAHPKATTQSISPRSEPRNTPTDK